MSTIAPPTSSALSGARKAPRALTATAGASGAVHGCDVLADLRTRVAASPSPAVVPTLLWSFITFGIAPAFLWPLRFMRQVESEQKSLRLLVEWAGPRTGAPEARRLAIAASRVRFLPWLFTLGLAGAVAAAGALAWGITHRLPQHSDLSWLTGLTFGFQWPRYGYLGQMVLRREVFSVWTGGLGLAYAAHLIQVHRHAHALRAFLLECNRFTIEEGAPPVYLKPIGFGFSPLWVMLAVLMLICSAPWGVVMAIAGALDRRYRRRASRLMRADLAARVKEIVLLKPDFPARGSLAIAAARPAVRCGTLGCNQVLKPGTGFCRRCGAKRKQT